MYPCHRCATRPGESPGVRVKIFMRQTFDQVEEEVNNFLAVENREFRGIATQPLRDTGVAIVVAYEDYPAPLTMEDILRTPAP